LDCTTSFGRGGGEGGGGSSRPASSSRHEAAVACLASSIPTASQLFLGPLCLATATRGEETGCKLARPSFITTSNNEVFACARRFPLVAGPYGAFLGAGGAERCRDGIQAHIESVLLHRANKHRVEVWGTRRIYLAGDRKSGTHFQCPKSSQTLQVLQYVSGCTVRMRYCTLKVCSLYTPRKFQKMGFQLLSTPLHSIPLHSAPLSPLHSLHSTHSTPLAPLRSNQMSPFDWDIQDERRFCCPPGGTPTPWTRSEPEPAQSPPHMTRLRSGVTALSFLRSEVSAASRSSPPLLLP
jgi:hypothetical protein